MTSEAPHSGSPSAATQQVVSLLIVIHLFCVFVALSTYAALANYMRPSALQDRLREVLAPYTRTLLLAPSLAPYHLTQYNAGTGANSFDDDVYLEMSVTRPDGQVEVVALDELGASFPDARLRFRTFAKDMTFYLSRGGEGENALAEFAAGAGGFTLRNLDADVGTLRLKQHISQPRLLADLDEGFPEDPTSPRYIETLYEADIVIADDGEVQVIKREGAGVVAPPIAAPATPAGK